VVAERFVVGSPPPRLVIDEDPVGGNTLPMPGLDKGELVPGRGYEAAGGVTGGSPYGVAGAGLLSVGVLEGGTLAGGNVPEVGLPGVVPYVGGDVGGKVEAGGNVFPPPMLPGGSEGPLGGVAVGRSEMPPEVEPVGGDE
jgi:hypothetical protein